MPSKYEAAANETVPIARTIIAKELVERYKLTETVAAEYLDVAQAAISKYLSGKYSDGLREKGEEVGDAIAGKRALIDSYITKVAEGRKEYVSACICTICRAVNKTGCVFSHAHLDVQ